MGKYNKYSDEFKKEAVGVSLTSARYGVVTRYAGFTPNLQAN
jgi:hypothetical protein